MVHFFCWDYLLRLFFLFSPVHCCASRTACFFANQTGETEIVWVKENKKDGKGFDRIISRWIGSLGHLQCRCTSSLFQHMWGCWQRGDLSWGSDTLSCCCCQESTAEPDPDAPGLAYAGTREKGSILPAHVLSALTERKAWIQCNLSPCSLWFLLFFPDCPTGRKSHFNFWTPISDCKCSELLAFFWHCIIAWSGMCSIEKRKSQMWMQQLAWLFHVFCTKNYIKGFERFAVLNDQSSGWNFFYTQYCISGESDCSPLGAGCGNQAKQSRTKCFCSALLAGERQLNSHAFYHKDSCLLTGSTLT